MYSPSTSHQARAHMPDPCHAENLQGFQRRPQPAEIVFFGLLCNFSKEHNFKKRGIIWKKENNFSIISPKKAMLLA